MCYLRTKDHTIPLDKSEHTIGRFPSNDIIVNHRSASRCHATLRRIGLIYTLSDLNSLNGTFVNGKRITNAELNGGETVTIGRVDFQFCQGRVEDAAIRVGN